MKLAILSLLLGAVLAASAAPARIILIRHAEKPADERDVHLSEQGRDRAERLVKWLIEGKELGTNGVPAALYAASPTARGKSVRCVETLEPTARSLGLTLRTPRLADDYARLAHELLKDESLKGKNVVVCWVHDYLPQFATALGVKPQPLKWRGDDFDTAYVITFPDGKATLDYAVEKLKKQKKK